ncbi:MAG: hypothetical protein Ta2E_09070 [Mycoplasmoidaceae bacterium]|nr:MAG: hypothetical protein Ta2E_09070 [Mycoplasmoidaceae bacterium]
MEFEEKMEWMGDLLYILNPKSLQIKEIINPIREKFQDPMTTKAVQIEDSEEIMILQSKEIWLIEGELSMRQELQDPTTRTTSQKHIHALNKRRTRRKRRRMRIRQRKRKGADEDLMEEDK